MTKSYGDWLFERNSAGLPTKVPTPAGVENYSAWYYRTRGLQLNGTEPWMFGENLRTYGDWIYERHQLNLRHDHPPPPFIESYETWYRRVRGLELYSTEPVPHPADHFRAGTPERAFATEQRERSKARVGAGRASSLLAFAALPLTAAAAGLGFLGMSKAQAVTSDAAEVAGGLTPTNASLVQRAFDAINSVVPRSGDDIVRIANSGWKKMTGGKTAGPEPSDKTPSVPFSR